VTVVVVIGLVVATLPALALPAATASNDTVTIQAIQKPDGRGDTSPYAGQNVTTTGTVTAITPNGFYIQNGTVNYSGVFVYTDGSLTVSTGNIVEVTGLVNEYYGKTETT
jgi:predicted extracellular nuclease